MFVFATSVEPMTCGGCGNQREIQGARVHNDDIKSPSAPWIAGQPHTTSAHDGGPVTGWRPTLGTRHPAKAPGEGPGRVGGPARQGLLNLMTATSNIGPGGRLPPGAWERFRPILRRAQSNKPLCWKIRSSTRQPTCGQTASRVPGWPTRGSSVDTPVLAPCQEDKLALG